MFKNIFSIEGRIRRTEFALSYLIYFDTLFFHSYFGGYNQNCILLHPRYYCLGCRINFSGNTGSKRCHDLGNSGWFQFIPFYFIVMVFVDGQRGTNRYGANPKGIENYRFTDEIGKKEY